jgi:hypothetical protein
VNINKTTSIDLIRPNGGILQLVLIRACANKGQVLTLPWRHATFTINFLFSIIYARNIVDVYIWACKIASLTFDLGLV